MKEVKIVNLKDGLINGVKVMLPTEVTPYIESHFEWKASKLTAEFKTSKITGGTLKTWHHKPIFQQIEWHIDQEMFYFVSGVAIMLFIDIDKGSPDMESAIMARIQPGTQIIIDAGKGHFVAVSETDEPVVAIVVAPGMDAPRIDLTEEIYGIC